SCLKAGSVGDAAGQDSRCLVAVNAPNAAVVCVRNVDFAGFIFAKRGDAEAGRYQGTTRPAGTVVLESPDGSAAEIATDIGSAQAWRGGSAIHEAADHGAAFGVRILGHGQRQSLLVAVSGTVAVEAFHEIPAEVQAAMAGGLEVDFFVLVLADIADPEVV